MEALLHWVGLCSDNSTHLDIIDLCTGHYYTILNSLESMQVNIYKGFVRIKG